MTNKKGDIRPVAELLTRLLKVAQGYCETLGLTPSSRAKMGVDVARTLDMAAMFAQAQQEEVTESAAENSPVAE